MSVQATSIAKQLSHLSDDEKRDLFLELYLAYAPEVDPLPDEIEAIAESKAEYARGEYVTMTFEDWYP